MKSTSISVPLERVDRPNDGGGEKRLGRLGIYATIALAVPFLWAGVVKAVDVVRAPDRIDALARQQQDFNDRLAAQEASQKDIRAGLNRILSAMHLETIKDNKEERQQP